MLKRKMQLLLFLLFSLHSLLAAPQQGNFVLMLMLILMLMLMLMLMLC